MQKSPVLIHVPHASTCIPPNEKRFFIPDDLTDELLKMTDLYTDELFDCGRDMLVFPVCAMSSVFAMTLTSLCPKRVWGLPTPNSQTVRHCVASHRRSALP